MNIPLLRRSGDGPKVRPPESMACDVGLASATYLALRCREECYRAKRYGRPLALLLVKVVQESDSSPPEGRLRNWLRAHVRVSDIAAYLGDGGYALLLPETDRDAAGGLKARLRSEFPCAMTGISVHPQDGHNLEDLIQAAILESEEEPRIQAA
jgi:hypothetical protein